MLNTIALFLLVVAPSGGKTSEPAPVVASESPVVQVDANGSGSATVTITAAAGKAKGRLLKLSLTDFKHESSATNPSPSRISYSFTPLNPADKAVLFGEKPWSGSGLTFKIAVTNVSEAGVATATLRNDEKDVLVSTKNESCTVRVTRIPSVYNVQIGSASSGSPEIGATDLKALVRLKNSDQMSYAFAWKLRLWDQIIDGQGLLQLPAGGEEYLDLSSALSHLSYRGQLLTGGTLKSESTDGDLILQLDVPASESLQVPLKHLPATFRFSYWGPTWQQFVNAFFLFLVLLLGGLFSILMRYWMPNSISKLTLSKRLHASETKAQGMSQEIDSQWRRLLEAQAQSIEDELRPILPILPASAEGLSHVESRIKILEQWVEIAYDISNVLHLAKVFKNTAPPTVVKWVKRKCQEALAPICSWYTTPDELEAMKAAAKEANRFIESVREDRPIPELEKEIKDREARLKPIVGLLRAMPDNGFSGLIDDFESVAGTGLPHTDVRYRDVLSLTVDALNEFRKLCRLVRRPTPNPQGAVMHRTLLMEIDRGDGTAVAFEQDSFESDCGKGASDRLVEHQERFFCYLGAQTCESIELACLFLIEMRQDIYQERLAGQVSRKSGPAVTIETDPVEVKTGQPVMFGLRFNRRLLNESAACAEWDCLWNFGDDGVEERGWEAYHIYGEPGTYTVGVVLTNLEGGSIPVCRPITRQVKVLALHDPMRARKKGWFRRTLARLSPKRLTIVELFRLVLVLIIAVVGLMATAQTQIEKLSFLAALGAAFGIGFAADVLKSMVTGKPGEGNAETARH